MVDCACGSPATASDTNGCFSCMPSPFATASDLADPWSRSGNVDDASEHERLIIANKWPHRCASDEYVYPGRLALRILALFSLVAG